LASGRRAHLADVLVPHGERQLDAAVGQHQLLAAADLVIAVPDVQVGMAHAGREHLQQHLRALRLRRSRSFICSGAPHWQT
jgi:hypothetical protein